MNDSPVMCRPRRAWPPTARAAAAIIITAALAVPAAGCGGSPSAGGSGGSTEGGSTRSPSAVAYSACMRSHGVPNFPDPDSEGNFPSFQTGVSKQTSAAASAACKHLLASGGAGGGGARTQGDQQKLAFALHVARCMRSHGFPAYPDPTTSSQGTGTRFGGTGIDTKSRQFQTAEPNCEQVARKALGLP
jgi:hypothetical protein